MISAGTRKQVAKQQMIFKLKSPTQQCDLYGLWTDLSPTNPL